MDTVVQQNASLVEEAAAATESMKDQAGTLLDIVSRFRIDENDRSFSATSPAVLETPLLDSAPRKISVRQRKGAPQLAAGKAGNRGSRWTEF
jgi:methyl-accepting chemotaxis protein